MFESLSGRLDQVFSSLRRRGKLSEQDVDAAMREIRLALLEADVNVKLVLELSKRVKERALKEEAPPGFSRRDLAVKILYEELTKLLGKKQDLPLAEKKTNVILIVGIEGSGKTTTVAKLAKWFSKRYGKVAVISSDVIRPATKLQLEQMLQGEIPVFWKDVDDPVEIMKEGIERFRRDKYNIVIIDTAGRLHIDNDLMEELINIKTACCFSPFFRFTFPYYLMFSCLLFCI